MTDLDVFLRARVMQVVTVANPMYRQMGLSYVHFFLFLILLVPHLGHLRRKLLLHPIQNHDVVSLLLALLLKRVIVLNTHFLLLNLLR